MKLTTAIIELRSACDGGVGGVGGDGVGDIGGAGIGGTGIGGKGLEFGDGGFIV